MPVQLHIHDKPLEVAHRFTTYLLETMAGKDHFTMALSGGSTPQVLFQLWATQYRHDFNWSALHLYWGDERCVPPSDPQSNYGVCRSLLLDHVAIPPENIHRIHGESHPAEEAARYCHTIWDTISMEGDYPAFDLVMLGMGDDGHTASIFPHQLPLFNDSRLAVVATHPVSGQQRISLTGTLINNAHEVAFLVTGSNKHAKLREILDKKPAAQAYPAFYVQPDTGALHWFMDQAAWKGSDEE
ncbi:MAG: 6-phosphogluconolactonase [Saprospiraceae bacterium]